MLIGLCLGLTACGPDVALVSIGTTASVIMTEQKLPTDLIADAITGQDCNSIRRLDDKGPLCRTAKQDVVEPPLHCYRTMGRNECYRIEDPYKTGAAEIR